MNIFLTDPCPRKCAEVLDNSRVGKMVLETAQMLSTAVYIYGCDPTYKPTHVFHPCSVWARKSRNNFKWLVEHGLWLNEFYKFRLDKLDDHFATRFILEAFSFCDVIPDDSPLVFDFNCSGFQSTEGVFLDYKLCLTHKWLKLNKHKPKWSYTGPPDFIKQIKERI